jgi:hypothetical protein
MILLNTLAVQKIVNDLFVSKYQYTFNIFEYSIAYMNINHVFLPRNCIFIHNMIDKEKY